MPLITFTRPTRVLDLHNSMANTKTCGIPPFEGYKTY